MPESKRNSRRNLCCSLRQTAQKGSEHSDTGSVVRPFLEHIFTVTLLNAAVATEDAKEALSRGSEMQSLPSGRASIKRKEEINNWRDAGRWRLEK